jgi:hypothetical protein
MQDNVATLQQRKSRSKSIWSLNFGIDSSTQCAKISRRNSLHHWIQKQ